MSVSVVNGYVCFSSCDAAKAKQGQDPNAPPGAAQDPSKQDASKAKPHDGQPATLFGGALKDLMDAVAAARDSATTTSSAHAVDRLA